MCGGGLGVSPVLGYVFGVIMAFSAVVALALGLFNITAAVNGPRQHRPVIAHTVMVETQRHSPVAKEVSAAKDVTPVIAAEADTNKSKHHKPKVFARQRYNYDSWNARGYAEASRNGPQRLFSSWWPPLSATPVSRKNCIWLIQFLPEKYERHSS
jgi:hypothetical protein